MDAHLMDLSFRLILSLIATLFAGTCAVFMIFLKNLENKTDVGIKTMSESLGKIADSVSKMGVDLEVLIERTSIQEKRIDRLDFRKPRHDS